MQRFICTLLLFLSLNALFAQVSVKDSCIGITNIGVAFSFQIPGGDLADRFTNNAAIGINFDHKTKKNWILGVHWNYIFGKNIKENTILDSITTSSGFIINQNGEFAQVNIFERGFYTGAYCGKIFPYLSPNPNSGFIVTVGAGLLQHKIRIEDMGNQTPQLSEEYRKGYDRLTNGFMLNEFIGYSYFSNNKLLNFYAGIELIQGWTQNRRSYDYDLMRKDTKQRLDLLSGFKFGWVLPLYKRTPREFYYY